MERGERGERVGWLESPPWQRSSLSLSLSLLQTCRLGATMAVTMTLEEEFPLSAPPTTPPPHLHSALKKKKNLQRPR